MEIAGRLDAGEYERLEFGHVVLKKAGGGPGRARAQPLVFGGLMHGGQAGIKRICGGFDLAACNTEDCCITLSLIDSDLRIYAAAGISRWRRGMVRFVQVFWSIFWRSIIILALNSSIAYVLRELDYSLFGGTSHSVQVRRSLTFLPAAIMFTVLAMRIKGNRNTLFERRSSLSSAQWQQTYFRLSACAFSIVIIVCISAMLLNIAAWIAIQTLLPLPLFTLFWIAEAIWQTKSRSLS
jgi:hypothetical protein